MDLIDNLIISFFNSSSGDDKDNDNNNNSNSNITNNNDCTDSEIIEKLIDYCKLKDSNNNNKIIEFIRENIISSNNLSLTFEYDTFNKFRNFDNVL